VFIQKSKQVCCYKHISMECYPIPPSPRKGGYAVVLLSAHFVRRQQHTFYCPSPSGGGVGVGEIVATVCKNVSGLAHNGRIMIFQIDF